MLGASMTPWHPQLSVHHLPAGALEAVLCGLQTPFTEKEAEGQGRWAIPGWVSAAEVSAGCADAQREEGALIDSTLLSPDRKDAR